MPEVNPSKSLWLAVLCMGGVLLGHTASADADRHRGQGKSYRAQPAEQRHSSPRHETRHADRREHRPAARHAPPRHVSTHRESRRLPPRHDTRPVVRSSSDTHRQARWYRSASHGEIRRDDRWYRSRGWQHHNGRYWAPANYRGRHCTDRRHHGGVHYHVALRDYYDYYYPRYRYHGALPVAAGPAASVIISIPLF